MAKGGGRRKGRPRKVGNSAGNSQSVMKLEIGENSAAGNTNGTGTRDLEIGENSAASNINGTITEHEIVIEVEKASSEVTIDGDPDLEVEKEDDIIQIPETKTELPLRNRGMKLDYVAPTIKQGIPTACLAKSEIEKENLKWKRAVILYIIGETPTITYLSNYLKQQCNIERKFDIFYHAEGYFMIRFEIMEDRDRILYGGPHTIANRPTIVKEWVMNFSFEKEILKEIPLWIQLPNLPLNCWSGDSLSRIGSILGKPIYADECTTQQKRISYARLLVEVDVTQPLKYRVQVEGENGKMIEQKIYYEWIPLFCHKCYQIEHVCKEMKAKSASAAQKIWQKRQEQENVEEQKQEGSGEMAAPKNKGKNIIQEEWSQPKKTACATIQVGRLQIPTTNVYAVIQEGSATEKRGTKGEGRNPLNQG